MIIILTVHMFSNKNLRMKNNQSTPYGKFSNLQKDFEKIIIAK